MATRRLAGVIGTPIGHSLSPTIHGHWIAQQGVNASYVPIEVQSDDLAKLFDLAPRIGFAGFNVTAPHKEAAFSLCTETSKVARRAETVNLVVFREDGSAYGDSTDGFGFLESLRHAAGFEAKGKVAAVIGAGGASRAVVDALIDAGAEEVRLANRRIERAEAIARRAGKLVTVLPDAHSAEFFDGADLIVQATPFGMHGSKGGAKPWSMPRLSSSVVAIDLIYSPLKTVFLSDAEASGARCVDGLGMLLHQARPSFEAWFNMPVKVDLDLRNIVIRALNDRA